MCPKCHPKLPLLSIDNVTMMMIDLETSSSKLLFTEKYSNFRLLTLTLSHASDVMNTC